MKLVIDISENVYTRLFDNGIEISLEDREAINIAIRGGTPIPKGHGWIPVIERLPEKDEYGKVLVMYIPSGGTLWATVMIAHYSDLMGIAKPSFHIGEVGKESFQNITKQVIAWMPLPEPYKVDKGEQ